MHDRDLLESNSLHSLYIYLYALMYICLYSHLQRFFHVFYMAQGKEQTVMCPSSIN